MHSALVTGASSGIGHATATLLASSGFTVFAGVRTDSDASRIAREGLRPLMLDVTNPRDVEQAVNAVNASAIPLRAIVNNAGIAVPGPLEFLALQDFRRQFEVNVVGALAVTQAFLPLLRSTRGRIVFMSSVSGQIVSPYVGAYGASKFALEAVADALRIELHQSGIRVVVVQPGNVKTPIWEKGRAQKDDLMGRVPPQAHELYGEPVKRLSRITEEAEREAIEPEAVARVVLEALRARRPRARYAVGAPRGWQRRIAIMMPERLRDRMIAKRFE